MDVQIIQCNQKAIIRGVDLSAAQGSNVDTDWLVSQGIKFVSVESYIGNDSPNPLYQQDLARSRNSGLEVLAYNFLYPLPENPLHPNRNPKDQALLHYQNTGDIAVAADLEWSDPNDWSKWNQSANQIKDWTLLYLQEYERLSGRKPLLYSYPYFLQALGDMSDFADYKLWLAWYNNSAPEIPLPWTSAAIIQDSGGDKMHLPNGVPIDTDYCYDLDWIK